MSGHHGHDKVVPMHFLYDHGRGRDDSVGHPEHHGHDHPTRCDPLDFFDFNFT